MRLVWYKRVDSTDQREKMNGLYKFAQENLPAQTYLSSVRQELFDLKFDSHYLLDDYIILAQI